jgi:hypothetical protein
MTYTSLRTQFLTIFVRQAACSLVVISVLCASDAFAQGCPDSAQERFREIARQWEARKMRIRTHEELVDAGDQVELQIKPKASTWSSCLPAGKLRSSDRNDSNQGARVGTYKPSSARSITSRRLKAVGSRPVRLGWG